MEALIIPVALIVLALLAIRFGHDSRPGIESREIHLVDTDTSSVLPDTAVRSWPEYQQRTLADALLG